ncbi:MAG: helix-turn-helix transcriptional regulator [Nannocystaceae bacterium]
MDPDELHARVAARIRQRAEAKRLPIKTLASQAGVSPSHMFAVLNGTRSPTLSWLCRVADVLGCDPGELVKKPRGA